jgi:predicted PurR-regulated permease PerM
MRDNWSMPFRYIIGILSFVLLVALLIYAHEAVTNLAIAAFVAYLINPAVVYLTSRTRMGRTAAVNLVYFAAVILLIGLPAVLLPIFADEARFIIEDILNLANQLRQTLSSPIRVGGFIFHLEEFGRGIFDAQNAVLSPIPEQALRLLETTSVGVLWFLVILVSVHLFLSQWPVIRDWLLNLAPPPYRPEIRELYNRIKRVWMAYLRGQIVLMVIVGAVFTLAWLILGIPGALVLGLVAGLFTLVPDVGPFLAMVLAAGVALLEGSTWIPLSNFWVAGIVVIVYLFLINLKNFFLRPYIMGRSVHMNEALIFVAIIIATILKGILGALLVVPLLATAVIIAGYVQRRVLGLPPFEDDGTLQFAAPLEDQAPRRKWTRKERRERLGRDSDSDLPEATPVLINDPPAEEPPVQENPQA